MLEPDPPVSVVVPLDGAPSRPDSQDQGQHEGLLTTLLAVAPVGADLVVTSVDPVPARVASALPAGTRTLRAAPGRLLAVGAAAARAPFCAVLLPGAVPDQQTLAGWAEGRGEGLVPTATLRARAGSDTTAAVRLPGLVPRLATSSPGSTRRAAGGQATSDDPFDTVVGPRLDALAELEAVSAPTDEAAAALQDAVAVELQPVRAHLDTHPQDHARLVEEVEARGLQRVDWSLLNAGRARELALLYCFTPWNGTSGLVAARRIRARGAVVEVVAQAMDNLRGRDEASRAIAAPYVAGQHVVPGDASFAGWEGIVRFVRSSTRILEEGPLAGRRFDTVYSRAMFPASHVAAARYKIRNPAVHWRAEFSDPLSKDVHGEPRPARLRDGELLRELRGGLEAAGVEAPGHLQLFPWVEQLAYALADEIVFTNANQRDYMLGYCPDPLLRSRVEAISTVSHHPTLPPPFYRREPSSYALDPERVHIGYFGVFYATRGLTEVTEALAGLPAAVRARVQLHVFTSGPEEIEEGVRAAGLADVVKVNGYRPFLEFLHLTTRFDVLVVNDADHEGVNPYLPSKLSDYLGSGTDIWAISQPGSVLSRQQVAHASSLHDVAGATEVLTRIAGRRP
ncbi:hypothetical protein [Nocardioides sp. Arc9.136]|uniref:hypothetical protein n=1 Tax=Nocardioides sp. Arc9.136 TaxID=2996826 RepID=UPI0026659AE7|nr:hypothetical protein [Nocardioides sp. Arc9.136]WKN49395.1 hypothetical protein OSR43_04505 [Nocardioides sp. Arc9.136]